MTDVSHAEIDAAAKAILKIFADATDGTWARYRGPNAWQQFVPVARAALTAAAQVRERDSRSALTPTELPQMPIYGATEPDQGEDVLGMRNWFKRRLRKGEE